MAILIANNVTKRFGGLTAVNFFDVEIKEQSIHSIIGPNGAGKTTFFNCVTGFYKHEEGTILFQGQPIDGLARPGYAHGHRPHLSEHPPIQQHDRHRERAGGAASSSPCRGI